jgi:hypothetical protein
MKYRVEVWCMPVIYADITVEAASEKEAKAKAIAEAKANYDAYDWHYHHDRQWRAEFVIEEDD